MCALLKHSHRQTRPFPAAKRPYFRFAVLATSAIGLSAWLSTLIGVVSPMVAAVTAASALQPTLHNSVREVFWQIVGVLLGVAMALAAATTVGFGALSLTAAVFAVFLFCRLLRLTSETAIGVVVPTILIIAGNSFTVEALESRIGGVLLGGAVAVGLSFLTRPGAPTSRALRGSAEESRLTAEVLSQVAASLREGVLRRDSIDGWLLTMREVESRLGALRSEAEDAVKGSRWSPMLPKKEAQAVLDQVMLAQGAARTVSEMVTDAALMLDGGKDAGAGALRRLPGDVASALAEMLADTAGLIEEQAGVAEAERPAGLLPSDGGAVRDVRRSRRLSADHVKRADDTAPLMLGGALVQDSRRIETLLSESGSNIAGHSGEPPQNGHKDHPKR